MNPILQIKNTLLLLITLNVSFAAHVKLSKEILKDKIKGGWAGQTIGVTYGGPTEFRFKGTMINNYQKISWADSSCAWWYKNAPGLYDDLYMDLTFVDVFEKYGLDAPVDSFANAFAKAGYLLWHANQAARYNILNNIKPPQSGFWKNNPHADCIDFQIESDFAGLMSPAMPNVASTITDKIGHIMNYGDGWYGGVFVANMYSLAFAYSNIEFIVKKALKSIPAKSEFHKCIDDVIRWHKKYPGDWRTAWFEVQKKWTDDVGCPEGVYNPLNIDAKVNAAYIVIGLLYGKGDFEKTMEISTRCGQDSDCNPSNAAGILGTIMGYNKIPDKWKNSLKQVEDINFKFTTISLNKVYNIGYEHALKNIEQHGGKALGNDVSIKFEFPKPVRFEKSFPNLFPIARNSIGWGSTNVDECNLAFEGTGFVITLANDIADTASSNYVGQYEIVIDSVKYADVNIPQNYNARRDELYWNYELPKQAHSIKIKWLNPVEGKKAKLAEAIYYSDNPLN
jgi:hypothetical protein